MVTAFMLSSLVSPKKVGETILEQATQRQLQRRAEREQLLQERERMAEDVRQVCIEWLRWL